LIEVVKLDEFFVKIPHGVGNSIILEFYERDSVSPPPIMRKESTGGPSSPRKYSMGMSRRISTDEKGQDEAIQLHPNSHTQRYLIFEDSKVTKEWVAHYYKALTALPFPDNSEESTDLDYGWKHKVRLDFSRLVINFI
jgi:hypothetical protein